MNVEGKRWLCGPADPATTTFASSVSLPVLMHERFILFQTYGPGGKLPVTVNVTVFVVTLPPALFILAK